MNQRTLQRSFLALCIWATVGLTGFLQAHPEEPSSPADATYAHLLNQAQEPTALVDISEPSEVPDSTLPAPTSPQEEPSVTVDDGTYTKLLSQVQAGTETKTLSTEVVKQLEVLSNIISDLAQILNNNQLKLTTQQKSHVRAELMKLGNVLGQLRYSSFMIKNSQEFTPIVQFLASVTHSLNAAIKTGLKEFHLATHVNRLPAADVDLKELYETLDKNAASLEILKKEAPYVGLSVFNKWYNQFQVLNHKYNISRWALRATLLALGAALVYYRNHPEFQIEVPEHLDEKRGTRLLVREQRELKNIEQINSDGIPRAGYNNKEILDQITPLRRIIGFPLPSNGKIATMHPKAKGIFTYIESYFGSEVMGIFNWANPGIFSFVDILSPYIKDSFKSAVAFGAKCWLQVDNILKGKPYRSVGLSEFEKEVKVTLEDVIGNDAIKKELYRLVAYVVGSGEFDRQGLWPVTGLLFTGKTRTGKSFTAEALAGSIKRALQELGRLDVVHYYEIKASELIHYGISNMLGGAAHHNAPLILFIDEIDTIGLNSFPPTKEYSELLTAMSELNRKDSNRVIIIGATNKPEQLGDALRAPGRFGMPYTFVYPTLEERALFLKRELEKRAIFIDDAVIMRLAQESEGCSFDGLSEMLRIALIDGKISGTLPEAEDLYRAFDEHILHIVDDKTPLPAPEKELITVHQAGHALTRVLLDTTLELTKVTTKQVNVKINEEGWTFDTSQDKEEKERQKQRASRTTVHGYTFTIHKPHALQFDSYKDLQDELMVALAGHEAEKLMLGSTSHSYHEEDVETAMRFAKRIAFEGLREKDLPKQVLQQKLQEAYRLVEEAKGKVAALLAEHKKELEALMAVLFNEELVTKYQITKIIEFVHSPEYDRIMQEEKNKLALPASA